MDKPATTFKDALLEILAKAEWQVRAMDQDYAYNTNRVENCRNPADKAYYHQRSVENMQRRAKAAFEVSALTYVIEEVFGPLPK